jgi:hypothetical protein
VIPFFALDLSLFRLAVWHGDCQNLQCSRIALVDHIFFKKDGPMPKPIRCYDYVNQPYDQVCEALRAKSNAVFHSATKSAETRGGEVAAGLHVKIAGFDVTKDVDININYYTEVESRTGKKMTVEFEWKAAEASGLFPAMTAQLDVYPITKTETQLDFHGQYEPPLGIMGKAIDAVVGHRIAEASVHQFVSEVAAYLRKNTPALQGHRPD